MSGEEWRPIPGFEDLYEVSSLGRVRSLDRTINSVRNNMPWNVFKKGRILVPEIDRDGYVRFRISNKEGKQCKFGAHQLVAMVWHPNPNRLPEVAHLDHNRQNNTPSNLKWADRGGNHSDSVIENRYAKAGPNVGFKRTFTANEIRSIRTRWESGESRQSIADDLGVRIGQINKIVYRERWKHID